MGHAASSARWRYACVSHADAGAPTDSACGRADTSARLPSCPYREYARSVYGRFRRLRRAAGRHHQRIVFRADRGPPRRPHGRSDGPRRANRHGLSYSHNRRVDYLLAGKWMAAHRGCDRWVRLRALRASIAASLPGSFLPKLSMLSNPSLSDFRVDKNKTRSDMLGGFLIWRNSGKRLAHRIGSFSLDRNELLLRGLPTNRSFCGRGSGRELF